MRLIVALYKIPKKKKIWLLVKVLQSDIRANVDEPIEKVRAGSDIQAMKTDVSKIYKLSNVQPGMKSPATNIERSISIMTFELPFNGYQRSDEDRSVN